MLRRLSMAGLVRLGGALAQLVLMLAVTRITGAYEAGLFYFGFSLLVILSSLCRLGSELSALREVAGHVRCRSPAALRRCVLVRVGLTLAVSFPVAAAFGMIAADFAGRTMERPHAAFVMAVLAATLPAMALLGLFAEVLKAVDRATAGILILNVAVPSVAVVLLCLAALAGHGDASAAALSVALSVWGAAAFAGWSCRRWWVEWVRDMDGAAEPGDAPAGRGDHLAELLQVLRDSPALVVVASTSIVMQWIGSAMLGVLASPEDVAGYSVAMRLAIAVSVVNSAVTSIMAPRMAAADAVRDRTAFARLAQATSVMILASTAPVLLALVALPGMWLSIFGTDFAGYATELRLLVAGQLVAAVIGHSGTVLVMAGRYGAARRTSLVASAVLAALMVALVPEGGSLGAAMAMSGAVVAGHLAGVLLVRRDLGFLSFPLRPGEVRVLAGEWRS